jgi:hypothetical protein
MSARRDPESFDSENQFRLPRGCGQELHSASSPAAEAVQTRFARVVIVETFRFGLSGHAATARYGAGAPTATGRTGDPASPCARSGRIIVHDNHTLSLASAPRLAFWIW